MIDNSAHRLTPRPGMKSFNLTTEAVLTRLVDLGLRPTYSNSWAYPQPSLSVEFGVGSGWLWGDLLINASGRLCDFRAHWADYDGTEQLSRLDNPRKIREALAAHAEQRQQRIAWLAGRHGLIVRTPARPFGPSTRPASRTVVQLDVSDHTALADSVTGLDEDTRAALEKALHDRRYTDTRTGILAQVTATLVRERPDEVALAVVFRTSDYDEGYFYDHTSAEVIFTDGDTEHVDLWFTDTMHVLLGNYGQVAHDAALVVDLRRYDIHEARKVAADDIYQRLNETIPDTEEVFP
jgi:hypothetical protein